MTADTGSSPPDTVVADTVVADTVVDIGAPTIETYAARLEKVAATMDERGVDALLLSVGHDLPWLIGYEAMPLERLTMLVVRRGELPTLWIPRLEAARVRPLPGVFDLVGWDETEDPVARAASQLRDSTSIAVGDQMWARFLVELLPHVPGARFSRAVDIVGPHRMVKDAYEIAALKAAGAAVDSIAADLQRGEIALVGRTEAEVSRELSERIIATGHQKVNFAIVAAGENAASPHHHASTRVIGPNEIVLCDFGGTMDGYCSDITRCVFTGDLSAAPDVAEAYEVLFAANRAGTEAAIVGAACEDVDGAARSPIEEAGFGEYFIHRTGHGIGMEEHEDPYIVAGNDRPLVAGNAFSIEPGIYVEGRWGMRLEDIVVAAIDGPTMCNDADRRLAEVGS